MKRTSKRIFPLALATTIAAILSTVLFAPTANAAGNTWIQTLRLTHDGTNHLCLDSTGRLQPNPGTWIVEARQCTSGTGNQLWHRRGTEIRKANTGQCLDSNRAGDVYIMECNGGTYQKWRLVGRNGGIQVKNLETKRYLAIGFEFPSRPGSGSWFVRTYPEPQELGNLRTSTFDFAGG
ncbi:ricin-type beta-trefoil lectin domain protein [Streptomyces sp. NPDC057445]|uniref:RICIN domain-containing protein n=1 Tax=Streptomyces sp. NPDC057445 TaxID=3346136 RepID=UPI00368D5D9B